MSTGPTHAPSGNLPHSDGEDPSVKPPPPTKQVNVVLPAGSGNAAPPPQPGFVPPLDLGPTATYEDIVSLWDRLGTDDHQTMVEVLREMEQEQRDEANKMNVDTPRLFTIGSCEPNQKTKKDTKTRRKRANSRRPPAQPPTSESAAPSTSAPARPRTFKTVRVEDYVSDESDSDDNEDHVPIPAHLKGKGRAVNQEQESCSSSEHPVPTLNVRPSPPVQNSNHSSPFSAVLNAFHTMGERMERLETSVTRGLKDMDDKISGFADRPADAKAPQNPWAHKSKGPKAAVAKLLAARNGNNTIPPRTYVQLNAQQSAPTSSTPMTFTTAVPPPPPPQPAPGFSGSQQTEYGGVHGAQHPTPMTWQVPSGHPGGCSSEEATRYSMPTQVPQAGTNAGPRNSTPAQVGVEMSAAEIETKMKLCRKYVRKHLWDELLRIKGPTELHERCPPLTDGQLEQYMRIKERVINAENFRIDFTRGWGRCPFNAEARNFFARHFVLSVQGGMYQNPPLPSHWVTETMIEDVLDKVITHLYKWRLEILVKLRLDHHLVLFDDIEAAHLSSDEPAFGTDDRQSQFKLYYIIEAAWQSQDFKKFVWALDQWYLYYARPKVGMKQRGGNLPRVREALPKGKARVVDSIAPRGLWRNCYDEDWLKNLKVSEREDLNMRDEDYDFTLPPPPPIPAEFLVRRGTASTSDTRQSTETGECGGSTFTGSSTFLQATPTVPAPATSFPASSNLQSAPLPTTSSLPGMFAPASSVPTSTNAANASTNAVTSLPVTTPSLSPPQ
ncbi:hypothetical protein GSI_02818 [Ganoderma sinense ZZ0214-1]|uniref:Uncharacterized protein n=1 Tax=Ganoderma sinense ZZ0214-1 TaxID=1077348 RepID=A0A2G8SMP8_9APHY|nr:hypothetical protein GSI_02818 [Ganoderma sinense ZZ0214-1]